MSLISEVRVTKVQFFLIGFTAWFASGSLPFLELSEPLYDEYGSPIPGEVSRIYSYLAFLFMALALWSAPNLLQRALNSAKRSLPICAIIVSAILQATVAIALGFYTGAAYACLLLLCIVICPAFWCLPERQRLTFYKSVLIINLVYVTLAFVLHGAPKNRWVGGIHPNIFSQASIIMSFSALMVMNGWKRTLIVLTSLCVAGVVDSRYAFVTIFMMCFGLMLLEANFRVKLLASISVAIVLAVSLFTDLFTEVFSLDDADRGLSSGVSGRAYNWEQFLPQLSERPFFGYGFRNITEFTGAHNGFMQFVLENGLIISVLFFSAMVAILLSNIFAARRSLSDHSFQAHEGRVVLVTIVVIFFAANLQPQLINFGDQFGPLTLMVLLRVPEAYRSLLRWRRPTTHPSGPSNIRPVGPLGS